LESEEPQGRLPGLVLSRLRNRGLAQGAVENGFGVEGLLSQEAMAQDMRKDGLHVIGVHGAPSVEQGVCPGGRLEREGSADGDGVFLTHQGPGRLAEGEEVALQVFSDGDGGDLFLECDQFVEGNNAGELSFGSSSIAVKLENIELAVFRGKGHWNGEQEAVQLRLGKGEGPSGRGVVLGGDDQEGVRKLSGLSIDGNLSLVHGLKERGLGAGGGTIDLVSKQEIGEDGSGYEIEVPILMTIEVVADNVGGE